jgi:hypothetical protein
MPTGPQRGCQSVVRRSKDQGVMGKGAHSIQRLPGICGQPTEGDTGMCSKHLADAEKVSANLAKKREWEAKYPGQRWRGR